MPFIIPPPPFSPSFFPFRENVYVRLRPKYRLAREFERSWPIEVALGELPTLLQPYAYNTVTLGVTLILSFSTLMLALVGRNFFGFSYIPSHSMEPTIQVNSLDHDSS